MTAADAPRYDWVRLTYPRGRADDAYFVDTHGWFQPSPPWYFANRVSVLASLDQVRDEPVILMVSASGIGKSTAFALEHDALTSAASSKVDLKKLAGKQDPLAFLSMETQIPARMPGDTWHIFLDSFDEAVKRTGNLVDLLDRWLSRWDPSERGRLRLRLATRPGEPENAALEEMLRNHWSAPGSVVVRDMTPLTRDDVLLAAEARGVPDAAGFAAGLEQRGLAPVASLPVPLTTLLEHAAQGHQLPDTAEKVYRLACEQLCEEPNRGRRRPEGLGLQEVMRAAEHLAAALEFCGNGVLTTSLDTFPGGPVRLVDVAAAGGPGTGGHAEQALRWLTATPLFTSLSDDQWQFAHQGLQGFLAAAHLKDRQLAPANVQSLLFAGPGPARYVHPRHRDVAGWLAWYRPEVFSAILDHDPAALLSPDLPMQRPAVRAQVVDALFTAARHNQELPRMAVLHRADHPGLADQLAARITPAAARQTGDQQQRLMLALALARARPDQAPVAALLDVAEDEQAEEGIRAAAVNAVPEAAIAGAAARMESLTEARTAQVSRAALLRLWPRYLPTPELLSRAPATASESFWRWIELKLGAADVDAVAAWVGHHFQDETGHMRTGSFRLLTWLGSFLKPADGEAPAQPAAAQLAEVLAPLLRNVHLVYDIRLTDARETWTGDPAWRRMLAGEVLARMTAADGEALLAARHDTPALLPPADSIYWARKASEDTTGSLAVLGDPLTLRDPGNTPELAELRQERRANQRLAELTAPWFAPAPAWKEEAEQAAADHRAEINAQLERLLAQRPDPDHVRPWWKQIIHWLNRSPEHYNDHFVTVHLDLSAAPSCPEPGSPLRAKAQAAALHAVGHAPVMAAGQISAVATFADASEVTAFSLLDAPPALTPERWAGLALVLAFADCERVDQDPQRDLLTYAAAQAGSVFAQVLPTALSAATPQWIANIVTTLVHAIDLGDQVNQAVLGWVADDGRAANVWRDTVQALAPYDRASLPILAYLAEVADHGFPTDGDDDGQLRWAQAADLMLLYGPADGISSRWEQIFASAASTAAWAHVAADPGSGFGIFEHSPIAYWPLAYRALTPQQARQLYDQLARQGAIDFPRRNPVRDISGSGRRGVHSRLPELIAQHLTGNAARELQDLVTEHPGHPGLPGVAADHARRLSENLPPLTLAQFSTLTSDANRRIVRDIGELTQVVLDALDTLQEQALWSHGWSTLMWNREDEKAADGWWPTWEDNLSNLICAFLREHVATHKPAIDREVEIQPRRLDGGRTDIHVQVTDPRDTAFRPLTLIIEVKGCWNRDIATGIREQLAPYLEPRPGWAGILLVGYFHQADREHPNYRKRHETSVKHTPEQILHHLQQEIDNASGRNVMHARVLRLPLIPPPSPGSGTSQI
jgi:hypothetical protein